MKRQIRPGMIFRILGIRTDPTKMTTAIGFARFARIDRKDGDSHITTRPDDVFLVLSYIPPAGNVNAKRWRLLYRGEIVWHYDTTLRTSNTIELIGGE